MSSINDKPGNLKKLKKISDAEFFLILRENAGLFARTSGAIKKQYGLEYSRQAVRDRALKNPEELDDIRQQNIDLAEEGLFTLMRSKNEMIRFKSIELFLKCQGRDRGWVQKIEADLKIEPVYKLENLSDEQLIQFTELQQKLIEKDAAPEDSQ